MKTMSTPIRLYWGENYAPKPVIAKKAIAKALEKSAESIHLYPGEVYDQTKEILASYFKVKPNQLLLQNGIESILPPLFKAYVTKGDEVITFSPTFVCYKENVDLLGGKIIPIGIGLDKNTNAKEILAKVTKKTVMICLAWPNTTTGQYHISKKDIEILLQQFSGLVVIDECYYGIGKQTALSLIKKYPNLFILKGVSKNWGLAGIRVGWAIGNASIISKLESYSLHLAKDPIALPSYLILQAILPFGKILENSFISLKNQFTKKLKATVGLTVFPSVTTFIPIKIKDVSPAQAITYLAKKKILVKDTSSLDYLLLGIPPKEKWEYVLSALEHIRKE